MGKVGGTGIWGETVLCRDTMTGAKLEQARDCETVQTGRDKQNLIKHPLYKRKYQRQRHSFHVLLLGDGGAQQGSVVVNVSEGGLLVELESPEAMMQGAAAFHTGDFVKAFFVIGIRTFIISSKIVRISGNAIAMEFHRQQSQLLELLQRQELEPQSYQQQGDNSDFELVYPAAERGQILSMYAKYLFTYLAGAVTATVILQTLGG